MNTFEIRQALSATNITVAKLQRAERVIASWEEQGRPASEIARHRAHVERLRPLVDRREQAIQALAAKYYREPRLTPWRSCTVETWRVRGVGVCRTDVSDRQFFIHLMGDIREHGPTDTWDERRTLIGPDVYGYLRHLRPENVDWTGFEEAIEKKRAA